MKQFPVVSSHRNSYLFLGFLLAAALLLSGCSSSRFPPAASGLTPPPQNSSTPTRGAPAQTSTPRPSPTPALPAELQVDFSELRGVQIVLWQPFVGDLGLLYQRLANEFNHENKWGILASVVMQGSDSALAQQFNQPEAENLPQLVLAPSAQLNAWLEAERLSPLDPYLAFPDTQMDPSVRDGFSDVFWQQDQLGGRQSGIPVLRTAFGLLYNKTWAAELGFTSPPVTPQQFRAQACEAAKVNNRSPFLEKRGTGGWLVDTSSQVTLSWLTAFGSDAVPTGESQDYHFDQKSGDDALAFLRTMQEDGCLWVGKSPNPKQYFAERYALFTSVSLQDLSGQQSVMAGVENPDDWLLIGYPASAGGPFVSTEGYSYGLVRGDARQQMAAWLFIRWLSLPENQARLGALYPSLPVSSAWQKQAADYRANFPWTLILPLEKERILPIPSLPSWLVARRPLADAGWQLYNLPSRDQLPDILPQLDALIKELLTP